MNKKRRDAMIDAIGELVGEHVIGAKTARQKLDRVVEAISALAGVTGCVIVHFLAPDLREAAVNVSHDALELGVQRMTKVLDKQRNGKR
jgi:hypothetical protein